MSDDGTSAPLEMTSTDPDADTLAVRVVRHLSAEVYIRSKPPRLVCYSLGAFVGNDLQASKPGRWISAATKRTGPVINEDTLTLAKKNLITDAERTTFGT
jgi:hypothetical protein